MLKWFRKDPLRQLTASYERLLLEARDLQRKGDIVGYAGKSVEADAVLKEIDRLQMEKSAQNA